MDGIRFHALNFAVWWFEVGMKTPAFHKQFLSQAYNYPAIGTRNLCGVTMTAGPKWWSQ